MDNNDTTTLRDQEVPPALARASHGDGVVRVFSGNVAGRVEELPAIYNQCQRTICSKSRTINSME